MTHRSETSGIRLDEAEAAIIKGMRTRGDRQHDIAAFFGVNGGRIAEICTGQKFPEVQPASQDVLPPPGPYLTHAMQWRGNNGDGDHAS